MALMLWIITTDTLIFASFFASLCHLPLPPLSVSHPSTASLLRSLATHPPASLHARLLISHQTLHLHSAFPLDTLLDFLLSWLCARGSSETKLKDGQSAQVLGSLYFFAANLLIALGRNKARWQWSQSTSSSSLFPTYSYCARMEVSALGIDAKLWTVQSACVWETCGEVWLRIVLCGKLW